MKMNRKAGTLLLMLALLLPASASVRADGVESRAGVDFVHTPSVFDTCYSAFRRVSQVYRHYSHLGAAVLKDRSLSDKVNRILGAGSRAPQYESMFIGGEGDVLQDLYLIRFGRPWERPDDYKDSIRSRLEGLKSYADSLRRCGMFDLDADKARLVAQLTAFRDTATVLPPVFVTIEVDFDGDVQRYADHLYGHSAVTNSRALRKLLRRPTMRRMAKDPGFQFVVSKLMYRLWEQQGRPMSSQVDNTQRVILRTGGASLSDAKR